MNVALLFFIYGLFIFIYMVDGVFIYISIDCLYVPMDCYIYIYIYMDDGAGERDKRLVL